MPYFNFPLGVSIELMFFVCVFSHTCRWKRSLCINHEHQCRCKRSCLPGCPGRGPSWMSSDARAFHLLHQDVSVLLVPPQMQDCEVNVEQNDLIHFKSCFFFISHHRDGKKLRSLPLPFAAAAAAGDVLISLNFTSVFHVGNAGAEVWCHRRVHEGAFC